MSLNTQTDGAIGLAQREHMFHRVENQDSVQLIPLLLPTTTDQSIISRITSAQPASLFKYVIITTVGAIRDGVKLARDGKHSDAVKKIDETVFDTFREMGEKLGRPPVDETELPRFIDWLRSKGLINEHDWRSLLDLLLILDGLKLQVLEGGRLTEDDCRLLSELAAELAAKAETVSSYLTDQASTTWPSSAISFDYV